MLRHIDMIFMPLLAPQPYQFGPDYGELMTQITKEAKIFLLRNALKNIWGEPKRQGVVFFNRLFLGLGSLLATLHARGEWNRIAWVALDQRDNTLPLTSTFSTAGLSRSS